MEAIVNKVAESGLITLNLEDLLPDANDIAVFDLKPFLFKEMILREKDFREALKNIDQTTYKDKHVAITCSADAIIPMWAYMLTASLLEPEAAGIFYGTEAALRTHLLLQNFENLPVNEYQDARIVVKGCGDVAIPESAYVAITAKLRPVVKSIMYGEPCSTVPVYKRK